MINKTILENKLRIITKKLENTNSVTVLILVGAGSRYERKNINGISHFLEHMFFKGAKKYTNTKEVSGAIDSVGGDFNAFTGKEYAGYYVKVAADKINVALDVLSDMLINSKFDSMEIDKERGVIMEEYNMYQDTPMYQIGWDFEKLVFGDCPMGWDQVGTKDVIMGVTHEQFVDYFNKLYTPENIVIAVAGNVDHDWLVKEVKRLFIFNDFKKSLNYVPFGEYKKDSFVSLKKKKTEQAHLMIGFPGLAENDEKIYVSKLLTVILGGNMSSRMFLSVREEKGLAYYISTTMDEYLDCGTFTTSAGVTVSRIDEAIEAILKEYEKAEKDGVTEKELENAKAYLKGKITLHLENSEEYAHLLGKYELLFGKIRSVEDIEKRIDMVTVEQVNQLAKVIFQKEKLRLAVIGPYENEERFKTLLKN